jgi:hypothetical protein
MRPPVSWFQLELLKAVMVLVCFDMSALAEPALTIVQDIGFFHLDQFGQPSTERGGVAGAPFDVQPVLKVTGIFRFQTTISVEIANNPAMSRNDICGALIGSSIAKIDFSDSTGLARYTDLGLDRPGRGYSFRFCLGPCGTKNSTTLVSTPFNILYGRLRVFSGVGSSVAGTAFSSQPRILIENLVDTTFQLSTEYTYGVSAVAVKTSRLEGRTTLWPALGLVQFTDLRMDTSSLQSRSGQYANFTMVFSSCYGVPEEDCLLDLPMRAALNFTVAPADAAGAAVISQPNSSIANRALGSVCRLLSWSRCKRFVSVNPPTVAVIDRFGNPIDGVGMYKVCIQVLRVPGLNATVNATGTLQVPLSYGLASFSEVYVSEASTGKGYILRFTVISLFGIGNTHSDPQCSGSVFATVDSAPFSVSASEITNLLVGKLPPTFVAAARISPDRALSAHLTDNVGNVATGLWIEKESPQVSVEIEQYNGSGRFGRYVFSCDLVGTCVQMKSLAAPAINGIATFESFTLKSSGTYTVRFYAESLEVYSSVFTVVNSDAVRFDPKISPLHSPCWGPPTIRGSSPTCRSGGVLRPFLSGPVFDVFDNIAATGQFKFTVRISSSTTANIFCQGQLFQDLAGAFCSVNSEKGVLTFTDLAVTKVAAGLRLSVGVYGQDLSNPVSSPLFDAYALTDIIVDSDPTAQTQAGCALWPPPIISLMGYTSTTSNKTAVIPLSNIPVSAYIFGCNETERNFVFNSDATLLSPELQTSLCSSTPRVGIPCSATFKLRPAINARPAYKAWGKTFYLYYCATSSVTCPQSGFWRISQFEGFCQNSNDTLQMQACSTAAAPDLISSTQKWSFRNSNCLSNQTITMLNEPRLCSSYAVFIPSISQCNATGTTTVSSVDGKAVFSNLRLSTKGLVTLRFMVRLESSLPFFKDRSFIISEAAVSSITAVQGPSSGTIGTRAQSPALYIVQVNDTFGQGMKGWQCNLNACFSGGVTVTAFVFEVSLAASLGPPVNQATGILSLVPSYINAIVDHNRSGVIRFQILTTQPGYFILRLNASYSSTCSYIPESTDKDHVLDSAPFRMTLVDVSEIRVESISHVVSNGNTPVNLQSLEILAGREVNIKAAMYDSKGGKVITDDEAFLQFEGDEDIPGSKILFDSCRVNDITCTGKLSSEGKLFTSGETQFSFVALVSGQLNLRIKVPSLGLESDTLPFLVMPGQESRIWVVVNPPASAVAGDVLHPRPWIAIYDQYGNRKDRVLVTNLTVLSQVSGVVLEILYGPTTIEVSGNGVPFNAIRLFRGAPGCSTANNIMSNVKSNSGIQLVFKALIQLSPDDTPTLVANISQTKIILQANQSQGGLAALPLNEVGNVTAMAYFSINLQIVDQHLNFVCSRIQVTILTAICKANVYTSELANTSLLQENLSGCSPFGTYLQNGDSFVTLNNLVSNYTGFFRLKFSIAQSVTDSTYSNIFSISSGKAVNAIFIQLPLDSVAEEALRFESKLGDITNRLDVIVVDRASNVLSTACSGQIYIQANFSFNRTEVFLLGTSASDDGNISFQTLVPLLQGFEEPVQCILIFNTSSTPSDPSLVAESTAFTVSFVWNLKILGNPVNGSIGSEIKDSNNESISVAVVDYYGEYVRASSRAIRVYDIVDQEERLLLCLINEGNLVNNKCRDVKAVNGIATFNRISATTASRKHQLLFTASSEFTQLKVSSNQFSISDPPGQYLTLVREKVGFSLTVGSELPTFVLYLSKFDRGKNRAVNVTLAQLSEGTYHALPDSRLFGRTSASFNNSKCVLGTHHSAVQLLLVDQCSVSLLFIPLSDSSCLSLTRTSHKHYCYCVLRYLPELEHLQSLVFRCVACPLPYLGIALHAHWSDSECLQVVTPSLQI